MNPTAIDRYHARLRRALDHIDGHLDGDLSVITLAAVAAFSPCHFHRQFAALFGLGVYDYVQLARLKRASYRLAFRDGQSITEIALDSSYDSPEAFARAFKKRFEQTPREFRRQPAWSRWHHAYSRFNQTRQITMDTSTPPVVQIVDFPRTPVALLSHHGHPDLIGDTIRRFIAWRKQVGLPPRISATFNLLHNDPQTTAPEDYRMDLCAATTAPVAPNEAGIIDAVIPAGRCAVVRQTGHSDDLRPSVDFLYARWLPGSGEETRDFPIFAQRVRFFPEVPENQAITDIFLPLGPGSPSPVKA